MSLQQDIMTALKEAMKSKDQIALTALRAVKSAILIAQTESGAKEDLTEDQELKILQKLVKQRKDSAAIYLEQDRKDLALPEIDEAEVINQFLPEAITDEEIEKVVVGVTSYCFTISTKSNCSSRRSKSSTCTAIVPIPFYVVIASPGCKGSRCYCKITF